MASIENSGQSSVNPFVADVEYTESVPPTTIDMTSNSISSVPYVRLSKKKKEEHNKIESHQRLNKNQNYLTDAFIIKMSQRLVLRKKLHKHLAFLSDIMCFLGILGIVLMIIENELTFKQIEDKDTIAAWSIRLTITISTAILIVVILIYHRLKLSLSCIDNSFDDWRRGLTKKGILLITLEIIICAVHPVPRSFPRHEQEIMETSNSTEPTPYPYSHINIDVALGLPMFARLYLLHGPILYHSQLVRSAASQSIGFLSAVSIDFSLVIKTYLKDWPGRCLLVWCTVIFLIASWCLRACEYQPTHEHWPLADGMWLVATVFGTVGYSSVAPLTHCGRVICGLSNLFGLFTVAIFIAIVVQQLALNRWETYVHTFISNAELAKEHKHQAANVIKFAWKIWSWKAKKTPFSSMQRLHLQRKLYQSIGIIQQIRNEQRNLTDDIIGMPEIGTIQHSTNVHTNETIRNMKNLELKMIKTGEHLANVNYGLNSSENVLYFSL
ncbi:unnamed protein product [Rotaria sordida]|uniref:Calmodulin-binding domain-containing protein n=2 Tax=Rotaria sordida TaxID=392033 RepID=A0A815RQG8_9BILA|nr:unnamed protein product [Rotaria sordida]